MEINELGIIPFCEPERRLITFKVEFPKRLSVEGTEVFKNVGIDGLRKNHICIVSVQF